MTEHRHQPSLDATHSASGVGDWLRPVGESGPSPRVGVETNATIGVGGMTAGGLNKLLALLVALTLACGAAAGVAVTLAPAPLDYNGDGY